MPHIYVHDVEDTLDGPIETERTMKDPTTYQSDWDPDELKEMQELAKYFDSLTEEEWIAQWEYAYENPHTVDVLVPKELLATVKDMIARHEADNPEEAAAAQAWLDRKSDGPGNFPPGWDAERVHRLIAEALAEEEELGEEAADFKPDGLTMMLIPAKLAPAVRELLAGHGADALAEPSPTD